MAAARRIVIVAGILQVQSWRGSLARGVDARLKLSCPERETTGSSKV